MVREKTCPQCGKTFYVSGSRMYQVFCSVSCASTYSRNKHIDKDFDWKKEKNGMYACRYNPEGCACVARNCEKCGHNPDVANARLRKMGVLV